MPTPRPKATPWAIEGAVAPTMLPLKARILTARVPVATRIAVCLSRRVGPKRAPARSRKARKAVISTGALAP